MVSEKVLRRRAQRLAYLHANPEQMEKARIRAREAIDRKRLADPVMRRKVEIYRQLVELQGGEHCAICLVPRDPSQKRLAIDHDWDTDEVRGLLCTRCNGAIGRTREVAKWLHNAVAYLERPAYTGINYQEVRAANVQYKAFSNRPVDVGSGGDAR